MPLPKFLISAFTCLAATVIAGTSRGGEAVQQGGLRFDEETFHGVSFTVVRIDLTKESLGLYWKDSEGKPFQNFHNLRDGLRAQGEELIFATNSGIYAEDRRPLGLHVENKTELRPLNLHKGSQSNFALKPNGVFFIDNQGAKILTTEAYEAKHPSPLLAVQSGPLLVIEGEIHPKFQADSLSMHLRNGIGVLSSSEVAVVIANWPVNLHTFASFYIDVLKCKNALYLDGTLSGIYAPAIDRTAAGLEYVGMLAVTRPVNTNQSEGAGE